MVNTKNNKLKNRKEAFKNGIPYWKRDASTN
jgi:hypothetical protein